MAEDIPAYYQLWGWKRCWAGIQHC